jgi:hypothetical protein
MQVQITTSLPKSLVEQIDIFAKVHSIKKNQFVHSFKRAALDTEIVNMAEEGLQDYKRQLKKY